MKKTDKVYKIAYNGDENSEKILEGLDAEQRAAVIDEGGVSLVIAGPGSGKTRTITHKIAYLVSKGVKPGQILLVTFTRAASREMIHRAQQVAQNPLDGMMAGTFHHVCNYLLRKYHKPLKLDPNFSILDEEDIKTLVKHARNAFVERNEKFPSESVIAKLISLSANTGRTLKQIVEDDFPYLYPFEDRIRAIRERYEDLKISQSSLDYDDLLIYADDLLGIEEVREKEASKYLWVLVDEFQDTNRIQYEIVKKLSSVHNNLMVVGDDAQSIYSFRGARYENIVDMSEEKGVKVYKIQTNYRSTPEIVTLVNSVIPNNVFEKKLKAVRPSFVRPTVVSSWDAQEEAEFVSSRINELVNEGVPESEIAVLYRIHSHSMDLQLALSRADVSFSIRSGVRFTEARHVKDVLSFLRVLNNPKDNLSWIRLLQLFTGVGRKGADKIVDEITSDEDPINSIKNISRFGRKYESIEELFKKVDRTLPPSEVIERIYDTFYSDYLAMTFDDYSERQMDLKRLIEISQRYEDQNAFISDLAVTEQIELKRNQDEEENKVTLTTVHQAKGLEWDVVFMISVNPGDFPSFMAIREGKIDEEERVFYVALTRARKQLYICRQMSGSRRPMYGNKMEINGSDFDFVEKISPSLYEHWRIG